MTLEEFKKDITDSALKDNAILNNLCWYDRYMYDGQRLFVVQTKLGNGKWGVTQYATPIRLLPMLKFMTEVKEARGHIYAKIVWRSGNVTQIRLKEIKK